MSRKRVFHKTIKITKNSHKTQPKHCGALPMVKDHSFGLFGPCPHIIWKRRTFTVLQQSYETHDEVPTDKSTGIWKTLALNDKCAHIFNKQSLIVS